MPRSHVYGLEVKQYIIPNQFSNIDMKYRSLLGGDGEVEGACNVGNGNYDKSMWELWTYNWNYLPKAKKINQNEVF